MSAGALGNETRRADVSAAIDAAMPFVKPVAVDELALRLSGLSGDAFRLECLRLTQAILETMRIDGDVGPIETAVVLATLQAAAIQAARMPCGTA